MTILFDKETYELDDKMIVSGFIKDPFSNSSYKTGATVTISISSEYGTPMMFLGWSKGQSLTTDSFDVALEYKALIETSGRYSDQIDVAKNIFTDGNYVAKTQYLDEIVSKTFTVTNPLDLNVYTIISLAKEVYVPD